MFIVASDEGTIHGKDGGLTEVDRSGERERERVVYGTVIYLLFFLFSSFLKYIFYFLLSIFFSSPFLLSTHNLFFSLFEFV